MFGFFTPRYVSEARDLLKSARKLLDYKKDIWTEATVADFERQMQKLREAVARKDEKAVQEEARLLDQLAGKYSPTPSDAGWRENCEVFLVAIIVALGVRTYFLQPFTIPTGSMQPTLNGIIGFPTKSPPPNILKRIAAGLLFGRTYIDVVCEEDGIVKPIRVPDKMGDRIVVAQEFKRFFIFTYSRIDCGGRSYIVHAPADTLVHYFHLDAGMEFHKGDVIARGYVNTGDHVFVDKISYNFRSPARSDVFVFNTKNIRTNENRSNPEGPSQFYIKRVGGLPNDDLRIDPPVLYQNGARAQGFGYERVMKSENGYFGYSNGAAYPGPPYYQPLNYLTDPESKFHVPAKSYFALGDNSYHSSDSRDWGVVPQRNIMGRGLLVYWPFNSHWGLIK